MSAKAGTNIVTRGLRFVVDYANSKCRNPLTGTPETCKNLVNFNGPGGMGINQSSGGGIQTTATAGKFLDGTTFNGQKVMVGNDNPGGTGVAGDGLHFTEDINGTGTAGTEIKLPVVTNIFLMHEAVEEFGVLLTTAVIILV